MCEQGRSHHQPHLGIWQGSGLGPRDAGIAAAKGHQINDLSRGSWPASYEATIKARRQLDALVVVSGDGTVHLGIQVCAEKKLPLGIVAAGSENDAAITLDLPIHQIREAVDRIDLGLKGEVVAIDLGKISGHRVEVPASPRYFVAVLSAGVDAAIAAYARRITYPRGPVKYKVAMLRELPRFSLDLSSVGGRGLAGSE